MSRPIESESLNQRAADEFIQSCLESGADHFYLAPGSRCTPLTVAVAKSPQARVTRHFDERGLAFACLGHGRATGRPGVFICTSGTAVANALPAVVEASAAHVPMLLLTADRPPELRDRGANQTIDQVKLFGSFASVFFDLPCPSPQLPEQFWRSQIKYAIRRAEAGPVHVNWMFREPFEVNDRVTPAERQVAAEIDVERTVRFSAPAGDSLVIVGEARPHEAASAAGLAQRLGCPLLTDISSGRRDGAFDLQLLRRDNPVPDNVIHVGGRVVSKRWIEFASQANLKNYLHLTPHETRIDPALVVTSMIRGDLCSLCEGASVRPDASTHETFSAEWRQRADRCREIASHVLAQSKTLSEPGVAVEVARRLPSRAGLILGNSMPIRDMDMFGVWPESRNVRVAVNRGASGIDGLVATAAGFTNSLGERSVAVVGDLSALHDLNSFHLIAKCRNPVCLVIVNNDGGGIFHLLPVAQDTVHFESYFATPHALTFAGAAQMFGLDYHATSTSAEFIAALETALSSQTSSVIEVATNREHNAQLRRTIAAQVREAKL